MPDVVTIPIDDIAVSPAAILTRQRIPVSAAGRFRELAEGAIDELRSLAEPRAVVGAVSREEFGPIYEGRGMNDGQTPLAEIYPRATALVLYALTVGPRVTERIETLFEARDFALGTMLDAAASEATERVADALEARCRDEALKAGTIDESMRSLRYSPGYCGWHVTGQGALFDYLGPDAVGISLRESFLMDPLKSTSGVIVMGPPEVHEFENIYPFCAACATWECRDRLEYLRGG